MYLLLAYRVSKVKVAMISAEDPRGVSNSFLMIAELPGFFDKFGIPGREMTSLRIGVRRENDQADKFL